MSDRPFRIALDFDHTINDGGFGDVMSPSPLVQVFKDLKQQFGDKIEIVMWSSRNTPEMEIDGKDAETKVDLMKMFLDNIGFPYDDIDWGDRGKLVADLYVDDKAYRPRMMPIEDFLMIQGEIEDWMKENAGVPV